MKATVELSRTVKSTPICRVFGTSRGSAASPVTARRWRSRRLGYLIFSFNLEPEAYNPAEPQINTDMLILGHLRVLCLLSPLCFPHPIEVFLRASAVRMPLVKRVPYLTRVYVRYLQENRHLKRCPCGTQASFSAATPLQRDTCASQPGRRGPKRDCKMTRCSHLSQCTTRGMPSI
jgi:hypothetical protein